MNKENELIKEYIRIYHNYYLKGVNKKEYKYLHNILIEYKDKLHLLNKQFIEFMLDIQSKASPFCEKYGSDELIIILDKNRLPFDTHYCYCMSIIMKALSYSKLNIENEELMKLGKEYTRMKHGFECYLAESKDFRQYMDDCINITGVKPKDIIIDYLSFISAYIYYNSLDSKIIYDLAITFMCYYEEIIDNFKINGFSLIDDYDSDYFNMFANVIMNVKNKHKKYKKELL